MLHERGRRAFLRSSTYRDVVHVMEEPAAARVLEQLVSSADPEPLLSLMSLYWQVELKYPTLTPSGRLGLLDVWLSHATLRQHLTHGWRRLMLDDGVTTATATAASDAGEEPVTAETLHRWGQRAFVNCNMHRELYTLMNLPAWRRIMQRLSDEALQQPTLMFLCLFWQIKLAYPRLDAQSQLGLLDQWMADADTRRRIVHGFHNVMKRWSRLLTLEPSEQPV